MRRRTALAVLTLVAGCGGNVVHLGSQDGGAGSGSSGGTSSSGASNPLSGVYAGYIESFTFPDGTDTIVMNLTFASDGTVTGTVYFGTGAPIPPATNPEVGYPPGYTRDTADDSPSLLEGFEFPVLQGSYAAPRLTLGLDPTQIWSQWCALQTPVPIYNGGGQDGGCGAFIRYGCLPDLGIANSADGGCLSASCQQPEQTPVDCGKAALCQPVGSPCTCTASACAVVPPSAPAVTFDMQVGSGTLDGSETGIGSQVFNVHFTKSS